MLVSMRRVYKTSLHLSIMPRRIVTILCVAGVFLLLLVILYQREFNGSVVYPRSPHIPILEPILNSNAPIPLNKTKNVTRSHLITTATASTTTEKATEPATPSTISPKDIDEAGFIPYTLGVSPLSDMKLIGNRIPEKIVIPVDISDIYFSVKTASIFPERLNIIMLTWAQTVPVDQITFTIDSMTNWTKVFASRGYRINSAPHCGLGHTDFSLCCKSGIEYEHFYKAIEAGRNFNWLCHIDDDQYFNVWKLKRMLVKYDPSKPWYIGKSHHGFTFLEHFRSVNFPEAKRQQYKFITGNVYCLSKQMMIEVEKYMRGNNFPKTCEKTHWIDDVSIAIIIVAVLGHDPTQEDQMWSHLELLDKLPKEESLKMISFGYGHLEGAYHGRWNTSLSLPNPRFSWNEDPTRFLSYHCMMYSKLQWCQ